MHRVLPLLVVAALASGAHAAPRVWLSVSTLGMEDSDDRALRARVRTQIQDAGGGVAEDDAPACFDDAPCVAERIARHDARAALDVRVVLAGDVVQLSAQLLDHAGELVVRDQSVIERRDLVAGLSRPVLRALPALLRVEETRPPPPPDPPRDARPAPDAPPAPSGLPPLALVGLGVAGGGVVLGAAGLIIASSAGAVLDDPTSPSAAKEDAVAAGWLGVGLAAAGVLAAGAGAAIAVVGLTE